MAGVGRAARRDRATSASTTRSSPRCARPGGRRADAGVAGRLPLHRRHLGLRRGRVLLPRLAAARRRGRPSPRRVLLETLLLSILNHDSAIAVGRLADDAAPPATGPASRWARAAPTRRRRSPPPARRTSPASPTTSNLAAGQRYGVPDGRHQRARASPCCTTTSATRSRRRSTPSARARRCWSTPTTSPRRCGSASRSPGPSSAPCGSTPATCCVQAREVRAQLDAPRRHDTRIVVTSDLDEYAIAALAAAPVDALRRRHLAGHRLRRTRPAGSSTSWSPAPDDSRRDGRRGQEEQGQDLGRRPQVRAAPARRGRVSPRPR